MIKEQISRTVKGIVVGAAVGGDVCNQSLSERRANSVYSQVTANGIEAGRIME